MNKFKKTAVAVTSVVMAGAMVFSFTGCGGGGSGSNKTLNYDPSTVTWSSTASTGAQNLVSKLESSTYGLLTRITNNDSGWQTASSYWDYLSSRTSTSDTTAAGANDYTADTQINIAIGYQDTKTGAFYGTITGNVAIAGGYMASSGTLKPAVYAMQEALDVKFKDYYTGAKTSANLTNLVNNNTWNVSNGVDICTTDLSVAVTQQNTNHNILNLADYLDRMPNFKAFLEENPVVYLSLLQEGMTTSGENAGSGEEILIAPYFDGNDDIERYCLIRQDWVEDLLDGTLNYEGDSYVEACTNVAASGWMGTTGSYTIETSTESDKGATTFTLTKDYDAALAAAKLSSTALGAAYEAIAGEAYTGTSGNIVDIMNAAISAGGDATGKELATLYRAYIDVAYKNGSSAAYSTRSDLFNGYSAAWDVDDLVAMLRIVKTNSQNVGLDSLTTEGIFPRDNSNSRTPDIIRLAAQLYGERGADSRYEYTYINNEGKLQDMRDNASFYQALENFGCLASENLVVDYIASDGSLGSVDASALKGNCTSTKGTGFMEYDYSQTQTTQMFDLTDSSPDSDYLFAAISTPVSRWDVDDNGTKDTIMRFTESWRSTKTGGLAVSASVANDTNKLAAVLAFIDYLYSNDGQILSTYGKQDTSENGTIANETNGTTNEDGTWYGNKVSGTTINGNNMYLGENIVATKVGGQFVATSEYESQYFCFGNELYEGTLYKGKSTPIVTTELYDAFLATSGDAYTTFGNRGSFTGYARSVLGATLPMGVKDQSFENQLTATKAAAEATKVSASLSNGTIKHVTLSIDKDNLWYTTVPTGLPLSSTAQSNIDDSTQASLKYMTGTQISGGSSSFYSIFHYIIFFGYNGSYSQQGVTVKFS